MARRLRAILAEPVGLLKSVESGLVATRWRMSCMRVIPRSWSLSSSGADMMMALIIWRADLLAATAVDLVFCSILRLSTMPSLAFGVTVLVPVNAASAAISASMKSSFPRFLRTVLSGNVTSRTVKPFLARCLVSPLP